MNQPSKLNFNSAYKIWFFRFMIYYIKILDRQRIALNEKISHFFGIFLIEMQCTHENKTFDTHIAMVWVKKWCAPYVKYALNRAYGAYGATLFSHYSMTIWVSKVLFSWVHCISEGKKPKRSIYIQFRAILWWYKIFI